MAEAASNGINFMAMLNPQFAAQQQKFALQQAMAQQMMEQGSQQEPTAQLANPGGMVIQNSPWLGLSRAVEKGLGAYSAQKSIADQMQSYQDLANRQKAPSQSALDSSMSNGQGPTVANAQALGNAMGGSNSGGGSDIMSLARQGTVTGNPQMDVVFLMTSPGEYMKSLAAANARPDAVKTSIFAHGGDQNAAAVNLSAIEHKNQSETLRAGNATGTFDANGKFTPQFTAAPTLDGATPSYDANGKPSYSPIPIVAPGALPASQAAPAPVNNPGNLRPVGATTGFQQFATPEAGAAAMQADLTAKINGSPAMGGKSPTLSNLISVYAPAGDNNNTAAYIQNVSQKTGIAPDQVLKPEDVAKIMPAMIQQEGNKPYGATPAAPQQASALPADFPKPAPPSQMALTQGDIAAATENAKATQARNSDILTAAAGSKIRDMDLQKLEQIANTTTKLGPGAETKAYWTGLAQQIPGINPDLSDAVNVRTAYKYFNDLSGKNQKALGGQGTDKQLEVAQGATPNPDMLNATIKRIVPFLRGQETALQAQANLRRGITDPANGYGSNTTQNLQNLEGYWQKNYDPDAYELAAISDPKAKQEFVQSLSKERATALKGAYSKAKGNGWIQ